MDLTALEADVLDKLLVGENELLTELRRQRAVLRVANRVLTGVGFLTTFAVPTEAKVNMRPGKFRFGDVEADIRALKHGAGFLVCLEDGRFQSLEGYTYDEPWPESVGSFSLRFTQVPRRALSDFVTSASSS